MTAKPKRRWYRLHWLTWLVVGVVVGALIYRQLQEEEGFLAIDVGLLFRHLSFGSPFTHVAVVEISPTRPSSSFSIAEYEYEWFALPLAGNCLAWLLFVGTTSFVMESWIRAKPRLQFRLRHLFVITAVVGTMLALSRELKIPYRDWDNVNRTWSLINWHELAQPLRWPLLLAIGCTIYSAAWLACLFAIRCGSQLRRVGT